MLRGATERYIDPGTHIDFDGIALRINLELMLTRVVVVVRVALRSDSVPGVTPQMH
jgi:hypothetical protein